jgi:GT2 family glycosyltransferase
VQAYVPSEFPAKLHTASVIIATRHRPEPLAECLESLQRQTLQPLEVIVVDSSEDQATRTLCSGMDWKTSGPLLHVSTKIRSAAIQRNLGAERAKGGILVFLDDDVVLEPAFLMELLAPFREDEKELLGGIGGTIVNEIPAPMSTLNRRLLRLILGVDPAQCAGRLVGPAVQFPYGLGSESVQPVGWLSTCSCAYRKRVFDQYGFGQAFVGYSFMEDVELSARIGRRYRLLQATRARLHHKDLGSSSHVDWIAHGENRILNRHHVMTGAMEKRNVGSLTRLFAYELLYCSLAGLWNGGRGGRTKQAFLQLVGGVRGAAKILLGKSPHQHSKATVESADFLSDQP